MMPELSLSKFADRASELMSLITRDFMKNQGDEFHKIKITLPQFFVLELLQRSGECRMGDIAKFINVTTAAITGIVDRLVRDGYALRASDPDDRRIVNIKLTSKGAKAVSDMIERRKQVTMSIFRMMSRQERSQYLNILTRINENIRKRG
ncbi:MAG: MarR family transcriptional regulator [Candidatus Omnitrophota bacterium]